MSAARALTVPMSTSHCHQCSSEHTHTCQPYNCDSDASRSSSLAAAAAAAAAAPSASVVIGERAVCNEDRLRQLSVGCVVRLSCGSSVESSRWSSGGERVASGAERSGDRSWGCSWRAPAGGGRHTATGW